jgi:hypothetical protein
VSENKHAHPRKAKSAAPSKLSPTLPSQQESKDAGFEVIAVVSRCRAEARRYENQEHAPARHNTSTKSEKCRSQRWPWLNPAVASMQSGEASRPEILGTVAVCGFFEAMRKCWHEKTVSNNGNDFDFERFAGGER